MLNDLLLGKPEDRRRFYISGSGFARRTNLKGICEGFVPVVSSV